MHFANARSLALMIAAWTVFLVAYDLHANPRSPSEYWAEVAGKRADAVSTADHAQLRVVMPALCCGDCLGAVADALGRFAWLGQARTLADTHAVEFDVTDMERADLAELDIALQSRGVVPDRVELFGIGHFRLYVELGSTFSCADVSDNLERFVRKESQDRWLDSIVVNPTDARSMLVYPRLNAVVDLMELSRGLARAGLSTRSIEIKTSPEF